MVFNIHLKYSNGYLEIRRRWRSSVFASLASQSSKSSNNNVGTGSNSWTSRRHRVRPVLWTEKDSCRHHPLQERPQPHQDQRLPHRACRARDPPFQGL
ncbi:hypothetical protein Dsin_009313 [Dipteronia sinensis]|uniref:Uncharacterized protein n=1 Tax=Dipteronia sinensis TaxID=43782 RepID=A0AAE0AQQ9_9ROSI|nr:hypothetical protein Dsin_009313 [Dipteronia sinensis]